MDNLPSKDEIRAAYERVEKFLDSIPSIVEKAKGTKDIEVLNAIAKELSEQASHLVAPFKSLDRLRALAFNLVDRTRANIGERWGAEEVLEKASELESWLSTRGEYYSLKRELASNPLDFERLSKDAWKKAREKASEKRRENGRIQARSADDIKLSHWKRMTQMERTANAQPKWTSPTFLEVCRRYLMNEQAFLSAALIEIAKSDQAVHSTVSVTPKTNNQKANPKKAKKRKDFWTKTNDQLCLGVLQDWHKNDSYDRTVAIEPIKVRELGMRISQEDENGHTPNKKNIASQFFKDHFGDYEGYCRACINHEIGFKLKFLSGNLDPSSPKLVQAFESVMAKKSVNQWKEDKDESE